MEELIRLKNDTNCSKTKALLAEIDDFLNEPCSCTNAMQKYGIECYCEFRKESLVESYLDDYLEGTNTLEILTVLMEYIHDFNHEYKTEIDTVTKIMNDDRISLDVELIGNSTCAINGKYYDIIDKNVIYTRGAPRLEHYITIRLNSGTVDLKLNDIEGKVELYDDYHDLEGAKRAYDFLSKTID
jgi:hypothetical protein